MDGPRCTGLDDELFPVLTVDRVGALHTDEHGVVWVCDTVEGWGLAWVPLARAGRDPRAE